MSNDLKTPLLDKEAQIHPEQSPEETEDEPKGCCHNSLGLLFGFLGSVFYFLVVGTIKYTYTLYPFLTSMDMQVGRCALTPLYCAAHAAIERKDIYTVPRGTRLAVFLRVLTATIGMVLYFWALDLLTASKALVLYNLIPLFVSFFAWLFLRERLHYADGISLGVSFGGVFLIAYFADDEAHKDTQALGVLVVLLAAAVIGVSMVCHRAAGKQVHYLTIPFYLGVFGIADVLLFVVMCQWHWAFSFDRYDSTLLGLMLATGSFSYLGQLF